MIGDDLAAALPELRAQAESTMWDECRVTRPGPSTFDEDTGRYVQTSVTVYEGRCRFRPPEVQPDDVAVGEARWTVQTVVLALPVDESVGVRDEDRVLVLGAAYDPRLVGRQFVVKSDPSRSWATSRRFTCQEVTA